MPKLQYEYPGYSLVAEMPADVELYVVNKCSDLLFSLRKLQELCDYLVVKIDIVKSKED